MTDNEKRKVREAAYRALECSGIASDAINKFRLKNGRFMTEEERDYFDYRCVPKLQNALDVFEGK